MGPSRGLGGMRHRLALQRQVETPDGGGGYQLDWETLATVWGEVRPLDGRERLGAMRLKSELTHRVVIRWRAGLALDAEWRLLLDARAFNIRAVINQGERDRFLELLCEEGVAT
jgi:SPP1 family predicted phage head-tail adaptor